MSGDLSSLPTSVVELRLRVEAAARRLVELKLPLLQCCQLQHLPGTYWLTDGRVTNRAEAVSVQLAAPQLTRLALNGPAWPAQHMCSC